MLPNSTAEEIRAAIETKKHEIEAQRARLRRAQEEVSQAQERQRLRRELDDHVRQLEEHSDCLQEEWFLRWEIDRDEDGPHLPNIRTESRAASTNTMETEHFAHCVTKGEFVWEMAGFSWLESMLQQRDLPCWSSGSFAVGEEEFHLRYHPQGGVLWKSTGDRQQGSLALICTSGSRVALRLRLLLKTSGAFVQWGDTIQACHTGGLPRAYGPDVHEERSWHSGLPPVGIFGLSHKQLLQSEWVQNDCLTVKCILEVRPDNRGVSSTFTPRPTVEVPAPTMGCDLQALWETGTCSDVQFVVQGEVVNAHSQVLCARSPVFAAQLTSGMKESVSKVIEVDDCEPAAFKSFLHFLYTDNLEELSSVKSKEKDSSRLSQVQALLAVSHKYHVLRLQRWCELQLCKEITASGVCSILCQAHLHQATELEKACHTFIKDNMSEVVKLPAYANMVRAWPEVSLKVNLFLAGVREPAVDASQDSNVLGQTGKRKREEAE
ncbi:BPM3 [Symbiodinium natans]|uniref:BPM3 protein n=1 Tax=Symbiodinium natans TaxID=878477 RepID=A0A812SFZ1_9DINO|nr:BPM3 [Symbiodinium natans]